MESVPFEQEKGGKQNMVTRVLKYREYSKAEAFLTFFLLAILISEIAVIFLLGQEIGEALAKGFATIGTRCIRTLVQSWKWIYKMVGPMIFPLLSLTAIEVWSIVRLIQYKRVRCHDDVPAKYYKVLEIVEGSAPGFGFLGTCIALMFTMHGMNPNLTQTAMLKVLLDNSASAFGSTVCGISIAITAFISKELFKGFLIKPEKYARADAQNAQDLVKASSINLIEREV
jgi:hypothetical protein